MITFEYTFSSLFDEVVMRLEYISGKRVTRSEEYFRYVPCKADMKLLQQFLTESLGYIALRSKSCWGGYTLRSDLLTVSLKSGAEDMEASLHDALQETLRLIIVKQIIFRWFQYVGMADSEIWLRESETMADELYISLNTPSGLHPRPFPPL